jgi:hypothetical protein
MRAGIGLLTILIAVAVIFYLSFGGKNGGYEGQVLNQGRTAESQASQFSGNNHPEDSIVMDEEMSGNELRGLKVTTLTPAGIMESAYGLKVGDIIIQANQLDLRGSDAGLAKSLVIEGYDRNQPLIVRRDDKELTLAPTNTALSKTRPDLFKSIPSH